MTFQKGTVKAVLNEDADSVLEFLLRNDSQELSILAIATFTDMPVLNVGAAVKYLHENEMVILNGPYVRANA